MKLVALLDILRERCEKIDASWQEVGREIEDFPTIVSTHIDGIDLTPFGDLAKVIELLDDNLIANQQQLSSFSDLYLRLFDNGYFWVEILNWWGSDINIHDHDFSAVQFQLTGHSLNVHYEMDVMDEVENVYIGNINIIKAERWVEGNQSIVLPGRLAPHNVCHLGKPTVSLLIRTYPHKQYGPQWNYFPPNVAASYAVADVCFRKRVGALRLLAQNPDDRAFDYAFRAYTASMALNQILFVLVKMIDIVFDTRNVHLLHELASSGRTYIEEVIRAAASHRAAEIIKALRWNVEVSAHDRAILSLFGSSFNVDCAKFALRSLGNSSTHEDLKAIVSRASLALGKNQNDLLNAMRSFDMFEWIPAIPEHEQAIN